MFVRTPICNRFYPIYYTKKDASSSCYQKESMKTFAIGTNWLLSWASHAGETSSMLPMGTLSGARFMGILFIVLFLGIHFLHIYICICTYSTPNTNAKDTVRREPERREAYMLVLHCMWNAIYVPPRSSRDKEWSDNITRYRDICNWRCHQGYLTPIYTMGKKEVHPISSRRVGIKRVFRNRDSQNFSVRYFGFF